MSVVSNGSRNDPRSVNPRRLCDTPVAVIGLGSLFPKSGSTRVFWDNIVNGRDCITDIPETHWSVDDYYDPDPAVPDKTYCKRGGFLPPTSFDPLEFGIPPTSLEATDVIQLLSLVVARETLTDAGCFDAPWYDPARTGVTLGVAGTGSLVVPLTSRLQTPVIKEVVRSCGLTERDAEEIAAKFAKAFVPWQENSFPGTLANVVSGRIANRFDFGGANFTVDAACAGALAAIRTAVHELVSGQADLMLTGGCDADNTVMSYMCFSKTPALSKSGSVRPFDESGDGTLVGEGIGMLALKRLADAERDGDRIYAVLRGIGAASDGRFKSIYAPRQEGQTLALHRAYEDAGFGPDQVALLECHGTGTPVGDRTELSALKEVYTEAGVATQSVAIGSVKSQIGHTKGAAGAAGMIKLALALHQRVLPPTINVRRPKKELELERSPFYVNTLTRPWIADPGRPVRRAGVSSFGFGGTNFHCVLEEDPRGGPERTLHAGTRVYQWHAAGPRELLNALSGEPPADGGTAPAGHARVAVVAADDEERDRLRDEIAARIAADPEAVAIDLPRGAYYRRRADAPGKVAALFAGQGSQYVGMGRQVSLAVPPVRAAFDEAAAHCTTGTPLGLVVFPPPAFDDETAARQEDALRATEHAQPAIAALSAGQYRYLRDSGFAAEAALGHSFGELTALWAAGSLTDTGFFRLARARGAAMAQRPDGLADPGTMAAVRGEPRSVADLLTGHPDVVVCNHNAPDQVVVGGGTAAVENFVGACAAAGMTAQRLPVAAAFHTRYVAHAADTFAGAVRQLEVKPPRIPVYANTAGVRYGGDPAANAGVLVGQLANPVDFAPQLEKLYHDGFRLFVEFGPGTTLAGLARRTLAGRGDVTVLSADAGPGGDSDGALKKLAARLWVLGLPLTGLNRFVAEPEPRRASRGMSIMLSGINYVSQERRMAYREALDNGYRIDRPEQPPDPQRGTAPEPDHQAAPHPPAPPVPVPEHRYPPTPSGPAPSGPAPGHAQGNGLGNGQLSGLAAEHLRMHGEYLASQLRVADRVSELLKRESEGGPRESVLAGIEAITRHCLAIGHSHAMAGEVLQGFARLAAGEAPAPVSYPVNGGGWVPSLPEVAEPPIPVQEPAPAPAPVSALVPPPIAVDPPAPVPVVVQEPATRPAAAPAPAPAATPVPVVPEQQAIKVEAPAPREAAARPVAPAAPVDSPPQAVPTDAETAAARDTLWEIVSSRTGYPPDILEPDMDMEADLGIDSIKRVEIMGALRERFPSVTELSPERLAQLRTLGHVVQLVADGSATGEEVHAGPKAETWGKIGRAFVGQRELPPVDRLAAPFAAAPVGLLAGDDEPMRTVLAAELAEAGWTVHTADDPPPGVDRLDLVVYLGGRPADQAVATAGLRAALRLAGRTQPLLQRSADAGTRASFVTVTRMDGVLGLDGAGGPSAVLGGLSGLVKTLALEAPGVFCRTVDLAPELPAGGCVQLLLDELHDADGSLREVGYAADRSRRTVELRERPPTRSTAATGVAVSSPTSGDLFVVTGGARGVTAACAIALTREYRCGVLLLGRTVLDEEPEWARGVSEDRLREVIVARLRAENVKPEPRRVESAFRVLVAGREISSTLAAVRETGGSAEYLAADVTSEAAVEAALAPYRGRITGIVHGAGVLSDEVITAKRESDVDRVLAPKIAGLASVLDAVDLDQVRHVLLFSSVAGFFGNRGQADYAMANEALNRLACAIKRDRPGTRVTAVNWGAWDGGMVTEQLRRMFTERGVTLIPRAEGARMFAEQLRPERAGDVLCVIGPDTPLSSRPRMSPQPGRQRVIRGISPLRTDPVIADHTVAGTPILPASAAMGAILNVTRQLAPGAVPVGLRDFAVFKGVAFKDPPRHLELEVDHPGHPDTRPLVMRAQIRDDRGRPRYGATVELTDEPRAPVPPVSVPELGIGQELRPYGEDRLIHGPLLRGIRRLLADDGDRVALECELADTVFSGGSYAVEGYSPVLTDLLLQAATLLVAIRHGASTLPSAVGAVDFHAPLPDARPFVIVVREKGRPGGMFGADVTACRPGTGEVLMAMRDVLVVARPDVPVVEHALSRVILR